MSPNKLDQTFFIIKAVLTKVGIWKNKEEYDYHEMARKLFYPFSYVLFILLMTLFAFLRNQSIFLVEVVAGCIVLDVKLVCLVWKKEKILEFLYESIPSSVLKCKGELQIKKIRNFMKFVQVYNFFLIIIGLSLNVIPLPFFSSEKKFPLFINFFVDLECGINIYWVAYILYLRGEYFSVLSVI